MNTAEFRVHIDAYLKALARSEEKFRKIFETSFSIQNVKDVTKKNEVVFQTWYAPAIDHWVKRITLSKVDKHVRTNETYELIDYGRKQ